MCERYSWIEWNGNVVFLTPADVFETERGKALQKHSESEADWWGHGAIRWFHYMSEASGTNRECEDFRTPNNFPPDLVQAIRDGYMWRFGVTENMLEMLTPRAQEILKSLPIVREYEKAKAEYDAAQAKYKEAGAKYKEAETKYREVGAKYCGYGAMYRKWEVAYIKAGGKCEAARVKCSKAMEKRIKLREKCDKVRVKPMAELWREPMNRVEVWR